MSYPIFYVPAGDVLPIMFATYDGGTGASITMTGLAITDIEIYKDGSVTQRASDAGYVLLDTDGIDFDALTGIHGFSIDTGDNTDAGFYAVGAWYHVVVSAITVDAQTVSFIAAAFRIMAAEGVAGVPDVNVTHVADTVQTAGDLKASLNTIDDFVDTEIADIQARLPAALVAGRIDASVGAVAAGAITAAAIATGAIDADALAADAVAEIADGVWDEDIEAAHVTAATAGKKLNDTETAVDTEVAAIKAVTDLLPNGGALTNLDAAVSSRATPAQVNTEVLDVLNVDTFAEPGQEAPPATASLVKKIGWIYKVFRNKKTQTATTLSILNDDAVTVDAKATISDDGTTYTHGEIVSGP